MSAIQIRKASIEDAKAIRQIYASYVLNTAITYETSVPSVEEFQGRIARSFRRQGIGKTLYGEHSTPPKDVMFANPK